jgi:hypothetical protein
MSLSRRITGVACVVAMAVSLSACGGSSKKKTPPPSSTAPVTTPAPTTSSAAPPAPEVKSVNPFTGLATNAHRVVAVKIDDTGNGRPQVNVDKADIVYIEEVEGGLTRLLAVYNSQLPIVEAVRSTRAADPEILAQYGPIAYVASGGSHNPLAVLDRSDLHTSINDRGGPGFQRDGSRPAPYNLRANLSSIGARLKGAKAKSIGLTFSATIPNRPFGVGTELRTQVGGTPVQFTWNAHTHRYVRLIGGAVQHTAAGTTIATPNVIVQFCKVTVYNKDRDVLGNPNMYTHTVGTGKVMVYRDGKRISGTWSRPNAKAGTTLKDRNGKAIPLAPGGAWVVLVATNAPLH